MNFPQQCRLISKAITSSINILLRVKYQHYMIFFQKLTIRDIPEPCYAIPFFEKYGKQYDTVKSELILE